MNIPISIKVSFLALIVVLAGCGGGTSDDGFLIEGTLTEGGGVGRSLVSPRHSAGERVEDVTICALGECSITDQSGQWGFVIGGDFAGGDVLLIVSGHGIDGTFIFEIPVGASEVFLDLQHGADGNIHADHITIDGETFHNEEDHHD